MLYYQGGEVANYPLESMQLSVPVGICNKRSTYHKHFTDLEPSFPEYFWKP